MSWIVVSSTNVDQAQKRRPAKGGYNNAAQYRGYGELLPRHWITPFFEGSDELRR